MEVEVERLPESDPEPPATRAREAVAKPLPPIVFGLILDALDFATRGPRWILPGFVVGCAVGYPLARRSGLPYRRSLGLALLCGVYCGLPATAPIPLGTLVGAYVAFFRRETRA